MAKEIFCGFGVYVDAVAGWLGSYDGEDSPDAHRPARALAARGDRTRRARARPLDRDQPAADFTRLRGCCTDVRTASSVRARPDRSPQG
jgi:hypothetical protein